ncbi:hypothetical protein HYH02_001667 [Chlamydomonas schloesseri]|uniref:Peptidase M43 pregnancy-associated plasma-A domain-containing protein n=1 Tax=Chlamydomonas schloesseri TaxID=2026947 RepID=A0A835WTN3_9CHLO|nr:hypothetical protein HYH02_001667 [Chlamydomonas schloesseri]|eukprot:KAG2453446.1 hypothetical protein HYH02_001667 [Chlamydomonas schloesseri]
MRDKQEGEVAILSREESAGESAVATTQRRGPSTAGLIFIVIVVLLCGLGGGFGIGWAARSAIDDNSSAAPATVVALGNVDRLQPLRSLSILGEASNDAVLASEEQWRVMTPALRVFTALVSAMANESAVVEAATLRAYLASLPEGPSSSALLSGVYGAAQRLLVNPVVQLRLYDVARSLTQVFRWARAAQDRYYSSSSSSGSSSSSSARRADRRLRVLLESEQDQAATYAGRRLGLVDEPEVGNAGELEQQQYHHQQRRRLQQGTFAGGRGGVNAPLYNMIEDALQSPALADARAVLLDLYQREPLQDLLVSVWLALRGLAASMPALKALAAAQHPEPLRVALAVTQEVLVAEGVAGGGAWGNGTSVTLLPTLPPVVVLEEDGGTASRRHHRSLLAAGVAAVLPTLPAGFSPRPPADAPNLLIPLVFHILLYKSGDGTLGPPGYQQAAAAVTRLVGVANTLAAPTGIQMYVREVRADGAKFPYLLTYGANRTTWLNCAGDSAFAYEVCGDIIRPAAADFPRSINVFVVSEGPPAKYFGYAFSGGSSEDPLYGHIGLIYPAVSTAQLNGQLSYETGAVTLWHEVMHHLGLKHTFSTDGSCSEDAADELAETPVSSGPVWGQPWAMSAYLACMQAVQHDLANDWGRIYAAWRTTLGIPAGDQRSFAKSCPGRPGQDELGNFVTYSYDVCYAAYGHVTQQQVRSMHAFTAAANPSMYAWAQHYAANPPPEAQQTAAAVVTASPPPPPPPSPSPPAAAGADSSQQYLRPCPPQLTRTGCRCKDTWTVLSASYTGCTIVPGVENGGPWCAVVLEDGCTSARNGWWDLCTPVQTLGCRVVTLPPSPPSPPPPSPSPPPPPAATFNTTVMCGPGAPTRQGFSCAPGRWTTSATGANRYSGCANPDNNPQGVWCALPRGVTTSSGAYWDLCLPACNTASAVGSSGSDSTAATPSPSPSPSPTSGSTVSTGCTTTAQSLPGCKCAASWKATVGGSAGTYTGCTLFPAVDPRPVCAVEGCDAKRNNGKVVTCSCL